MLSAMTLGSLASSPTILSAGGQDEQPCEVNNSTTPRGSARAGTDITSTPKAAAHARCGTYLENAETPRVRLAIVWKLLTYSPQRNGRCRHKASFDRPRRFQPPLT